MKSRYLIYLLLFVLIGIPLSAQETPITVIEPQGVQPVQPIAPNNAAPSFEGANPVDNTLSTTNPVYSRSAPAFSNPASDPSSSSHTVATDFVLVDLNGVPGMAVGEQFDIEVHFNDVASPGSVFSGYADFNFDSAFLQIDNINYATDFSYLQLGTIGSGVIENMGATSDRISQVADTLVLTIRATVLSAGVSSISLSSPVDPYAETTIYGQDTDQRGSIDFDSQPLLLGETILNGQFDNGRTDWGLFGDLGFSATSGQLNLWRTFPGWNTPSLFQSRNQSLPSGFPLTLRVDLGNTSNVPKGVNLQMRPSVYGDVIRCGVTVPANTGNTNLTTVTVQGSTSTAWADFFLEIQAMDPDNTPAIVIDNVSVVTETNQTADYSCSGLDTAPGTQIIRNESFTNGRFQWGLWGDFSFNVTNEAMHIYRPAGATRLGALFQITDYNIQPNSPLYTRLTVSNTSANTKAIRVVLTDQWRETFSCLFNVPANTGPTDIFLRDTTSIHWGRPMLIVYLQTSNVTDDPELIVDDVTLHYRPNNPVTGSNCANQAYVPLSGDGNITDTAPVKPDPLVLPEANSVPPPIPDVSDEGINSTPPINEAPTIPGF